MTDFFEKFQNKEGEIGQKNKGKRAPIKANHPGIFLKKRKDFSIII